jgi:uncharacterized protein YcfJ
VTEVHTAGGSPVGVGSEVIVGSGVGSTVGSTVGSPVGSGQGTVTVVSGSAAGGGLAAKQVQTAR